jgi:hypothetical protein
VTHTVPTTDPYEPYEVRQAVAAGTLPVPVTVPADLLDCARLREDVDTAAMALAQWAYREEPAAGARDAANVAVECIDSALRELHRIRADLVGQIRVYDDATAARTDALLARIRAERGL